jgi:hypothetical protein
MTEDKRYRECMAEIIGVLKKYDMAGAVTVVSQERAMFQLHFPTWGVAKLHGNHLHFRSKREDFPSLEAQKHATELSLHAVLQMRDIAKQTFDTMEHIGAEVAKHIVIEHESGADFDPETVN